MNDYIKREDVEQIFTKWCHQEQISVMFCDVIMRRLQQLPSADVVEVVRCKDCKYRKKVLNCSYGECMYSACMVTDNDFCSNGEVKTNGQEQWDV